MNFKDFHTYAILPTEKTKIIFKNTFVRMYFMQYHYIG